MKGTTKHHIAVAAALMLALSATLSGFTAQPTQADLVPVDIVGSTQMYTLGALLANRYMADHPGIRISTNPNSSQFAFDQTCQRAIQIGMSDSYIQDDQLREPDCSDMVGIPVAISATPVVYNLPGAYFNKRASDGFTLLHPLRLTASVLSAIYMGSITRWNDPAITRLNPGMKLPSADIRAFNSAEPGGSGFVFNQWLALSVPQWNAQVGVTLQPNWPGLGSTGQASSGAMAQAINTTPYSIGFAGFDYAISYKLQAAALRNAAGVFLTPSLNGLSFAIDKALRDGFPADFRHPFVTVKDAHAFNPACFEFFVVHHDLRYFAPQVGQAVKSFLEWAIDSNGGQRYIEQIEFRKVGAGRPAELAHGFIPVPEALRKAIKHTVDGLVTRSS